MSAKPSVDLDLREQQVQGLSSPDAIAAFFSELGYDTLARTRQSPANLGITAQSLLDQIRHLELIADQGGMLQVYLFELTSVTVANTNALTRTFRNRVGNFLVVLTTRDHERLSFVLVERYVPNRAAATTTPQHPQGAVRPRVLSVERLKPTPVDLRVVRRFTYTEADPLAQYDKLVSAFGVADWSETHFNNRALFADYYLIERLPAEPEWKEESHDAYRAMKTLYANARGQWPGKSESQLRVSLLEPALRTLGFDPVRVTAAGSDEPKPDYLLRAPGGDTDLAVYLAYPWDRFLDGKDDQRDAESPEENPGGLVVSLLKEDGAKWAIVTNGKVWRLYCGRTHAKASNYYEIDLEETLATDDPYEAFRYFWLLFRLQAFAPRTVLRDGRDETTTFLDELLDGSEDYAKRLGDRLKDRVFDHIFPHLARGFVEHRKLQDGAVADLSQEYLDQVFEGTLTLLYRLLFLLYAEARDLLPVKEAHGYFAASLKRVKQEVAEAAGGLTDEVEGRLKKTYRADTTALYDRLAKLFAVIDKGEKSLNVPVYNGGLFISDPDRDDETPEARNARFLLASKVPDRHLALALDLLARDDDEKTFKRAFIDYKSLGVRQLGSIYEGLLEFHLRVAPEKMAICKGKKAEEVVPYREATKAKRQLLKQGRGKDAPERTLAKGAVYLENTRHERKATGSYYTPDYIVKYIVAHTVGPVLEEKFRAMEPKLRAAQKAYRAAVKRRDGFQKEGLKGDDPEKVADEYRDLVNELFDVKVLDPAMGSGHFLVEAVDFITDRIIDFLNGFPWNPVTSRLGTLGETRRTVLREMEEQGITIDPNRLTDVNLLKRHVLKRCVYGVDLNPMAVELAKVSLWLHCFTLGAPLSFLDHHLKCGNSLIGARVDEAQEALQQAATGKKNAVQFDLLGNQFAGMMLATEAMRHVGELSDVTAAQVARSRSEYRSALDALAPFKHILDIYVSQWFGNKREPVLELLRSDAGEAVARDPRFLSRMKGAQHEIAERAFAEAATRRVFHWELEFPEVWYAQGRRKETPGFDAVVGNPPYVTTGELRATDMPGWSFYRQQYGAASAGKFDLYLPFFERAWHLCGSRGLASFILPNKWMQSDAGRPLRGMLAGARALKCIVDFGSHLVFKEAGGKEGPTVYTCIATLSGRPSDRVLHKESLPAPADLAETRFEELSADDLDSDPWVFRSSIWDRCRAVSDGLGDATRVFVGTTTNADPVFVLTQAGVRQKTVTAFSEAERGHVTIEKDACIPFLRGRDIARYSVLPDDVVAVFPYERRDDKWRLVPASGLRGRWPCAWRYLRRHRQLLEARENGRWGGADNWHCHAYPRGLGLLGVPKLVTPDICQRPQFALDAEGRYLCLNTVYALCSPRSPLDLRFVHAVVNSQVFLAFVKDASVDLRGGYVRVARNFIVAFPVRRIHFATPAEERAALVQGLEDACQAGSYDSVLAQTERLLPKDAAGNFLAFQDGPNWQYDLKTKTGEGECPEKSDVVHDFLAYLAEHMIELNKQKQAEVKRFLGWLVKQLRISPDREGNEGLDALTGKTRLRNYLGDYQKNEEHLSFDDLVAILQRNRSRIGAGLSDPAFTNRLRTEYESSLATILPTKDRLAKTDWLIDQVVYRLYGLTEDEIGIVEGRGL